MTILLFGTGDYYQRYKRWFFGQKIVALLDNDETKHGTLLDGYLIVSPQEGIKLEFDCIFILSAYCDDMKEQLIKLKVPLQKIATQFDIKLDTPGIILQPIMHYNQKKQKNKVYLFFFDLHRNGASIVFFYATMILKNHYPVCVVTLESGPLLEVMVDLGIEVIIDPNVQIETLAQSPYEKDASLIFCNTFNFFRFLQQRDTSMPVIWWLHEPDFYYHGVNRNAFDIIPKKNLYPYSVSKIAKEAFQRYCPDASVGELPYGIPDACKHMCERVTHIPIVFAIIGHLQHHKAQDVFVEAVMLLPQNLRRKARFLLVGNDSTLFAGKLKDRVCGMENIIFMGELTQKQISDLYAKTVDVLVCPSRTDSLPTVTAEAMMHNVPCIVSDKTGTAAHIHNGVDGWVVPSEDVKALSLKMEEIISHPEQIIKVGEKARKVYERVFSIGTFEKRLRQVLGKYMPNV